MQQRVGAPEQQLPAGRPLDPRDDDVHCYSLERPSGENVAAWDRLALEMGAIPFVRPGWVHSWLSAFADPKDLRLATVRRGSALVAVLPVLRRGRWLISPTNGHTPAFDAVARDGQAARWLASGLLDADGRSAALTYLPATGVLASALDEVLPRSTRPVERTLLDSRLGIDVSGDWEEYRSERLTASRRRDIRRRTRRLGELGALELDIQDGRRRLPELLDEGFGVEASGWKGRAGTAIVSRWRTRLFYPAVARWAADTGILRLAFLRHDGRAIAFSFGLQQGGTHYGLKLGYEESYARFSPGMLILHRLSEWCFEQPEVRAFEMLGQADEYKSEFATAAEEQERVQILRAGWRGVADRREELSRAWIRRSLREHIPAPARVAMVRAAVRLGLRP